MKKTAWFLSVGLLVAAAMSPGKASSHREAPLIALDPAADNTDVYAFVDPNDRDMVTLIANYIPFQSPDGGPNFYLFDPNVLYEIHVDNNGDAVEDVTFQWRFTTERRNPQTFLYNTGPVTTIDDPDLNVRQFYSLTRVDGPRRTGTRAAAVRPAAGAAAEHRPALDAELRPARRRCPAGAAGRHARVRRPARRGLLRRSRHLRSARRRRRPGRGQHRRLQRQHAGDPGADGAADAQRVEAERPGRSQRRDRRVGDGEPAGDGDPRAGPDHLQRRLRPGVAPRHAARQRSGDRSGAQGRVQRHRADVRCGRARSRAGSGSAEAAQPDLRRQGRRRRRARIW